VSSTVTTLEGTSKRLQSDVGKGSFCTGAQAYVSYRGEVVLNGAFGTDGLGRPMTIETVSAVYCAIKPMIVVLVLLAEQDGSLRRDMVLGEVLEVDGNPALAAVRLDDLLTHRAGMHELRSVAAAAAPPAVRHALAMSARPADGWDRRTDGAYSEWLGFYLIGLVLERAGGITLCDALRERVLEPLEIATEVSLGLGREDLGRIGVNVDLRDGRPVPLLMERTPWFAAGADPALNGYATMRALGRFYEWVLDTLDGRQTAPLDPERLRDACVPHRSVVHDRILGLEADWGLGFMTGLGRLGFGPYPSPRAVGHTGQVGTSVAFCDPEHDLAVALLYNGVIEQSVGIGLRRPAIVSAIYEDLGIDKPEVIGLSKLEAAAIKRRVLR
jgi:CubicO group peptidase (beta-lactamase class C family)